MYARRPISSHQTDTLCADSAHSDRRSPPPPRALALYKCREKGAAESLPSLHSRRLARNEVHPRRPHRRHGRPRVSLRSDLTDSQARRQTSSRSASSAVRPRRLRRSARPPTGTTPTACALPTSSSPSRCACTDMTTTATHTSRRGSRTSAGRVRRRVSRSRTRPRTGARPTTAATDPTRPRSRGTGTETRLPALLPPRRRLRRTVRPRAPLSELLRFSSSALSLLPSKRRVTGSRWGTVRNADDIQLHICRTGWMC